MISAEKKKFTQIIMCKLKIVKLVVKSVVNKPRIFRESSEKDDLQSLFLSLLIRNCVSWFRLSKFLGRKSKWWNVDCRERWKFPCNRGLARIPSSFSLAFPLCWNCWGWLSIEKLWGLRKKIKIIRRLDGHNGSLIERVGHEL